MKPFLVIILFTSFYLKSLSQPSPAAGRLKITIESARCINKSWDGLVEFDGHGNEISVAYSYRIYNPANPGGARSGADGTVIYGSNVNGMTRAGTQTPDLGGINNGDIVPIGKTLMDEHINADDYIIIAPTVWEWDGPEKNTINSFNSQLETDLNWVINQPFPFANTPASYSNPFGGRVIKIFDKYSYGQALKYHNILKNIFCPGNTQGNRVIGVWSGTFNNECLVTYPPTLLLLDTRILNGLYINNRSSTNTGTSHAEKESKTYFIDGVNITFTENTYAIQTSNGSYSVFFRIEFTPDASATSTNGLISTPAKNISTIKKDMPLRNININNTLLPVVGNWSGTQTTDSGLFPQAISFQLSSAGEFIMADQSGVVGAKGNYTFSNNNFSGSYKQFSDGSTYSFIGTYDPNTQNITCSLGSATTGQGKWIVKKK